MSERLELLKPVLSRYTRKFAVLDLGCGNGHVAQWVRQEFAHAAVFTIDRAAPEAMMNQNMTPGMLARLADAEYFSVVLALNFLHHFWDQDWRQAVQAVARMGRDVVIQLPPGDDHRAAGSSIMPAMHELVAAVGGVKIGEAWYEPFQNRRPIWIVKNTANRLINAARPWTVSADESLITKTRLGFTRPWIPGMNLWNMLGLGASRRWAASLVAQFHLLEQEHGDIQPWNFIYDGNQLHLIDPQDEPGGHWAVPDEVGLVNTLRMIRDEPVAW